MSLNRFQKKQNSRELNANFELSGLTLEELADRTGFSTDRLEAALSVVRAYDPADCWLVRDVLEQAVIDAGKTPVPFTVLSEDKRSSAEMWFGYRRPW